MKKIARGDDSAPGGAAAAFAAYVVGAVLCAVNIDALYFLSERIAPWICAVFIPSALFMSFSSCGVILLIFNSSILGTCVTLLSYFRFEQLGLSAEYFAGMLLLLPIVIGVTIISDFGFYTSTALAKAYAGADRHTRLCGKAVGTVFLAFALLTASVVALYFFTEVGASIWIMPNAWSYLKNT